MPFPARFRVRTLLAAVAVLAALAAWPAALWREAAREQSIARRLEAKDAIVTYERAAWYLPAYVTRISVDEYLRLSPESGSPGEPRPERFRLSVDDVRAMATLGHLARLDLHGDVLQPEAFPAVGDLRRLKGLHVSQGLWDDERLRCLEGLTGLEELTLEQTQVTEAGVARLQAKLPKLAIADD